MTAIKDSSGGCIVAKIAVALEASEPFSGLEIHFGGTLLCPGLNA